jgi:stage II sporulation protein P
MMVVGTRQELWQSNMALAVKLTALLEKQNPGITRPISFRTQRFNQDLSPGALLVEVGAAGNSRQEALTAAKMLAQAIIFLSKGAN